MVCTRSESKTEGEASQELRCLSTDSACDPWLMASFARDMRRWRRSQVASGAVTAPSTLGGSTQPLQPVQLMADFNSLDKHGAACKDANVTFGTLRKCIFLANFVLWGAGVS
jgi:hypothetical protein